MRTKISKKLYDGIYRELRGSDLKNDIDLYNHVFVSDAKTMKDMYFLVYSDDNGLKLDDEYWIDGIGYKDNFWCLHGAAKFLYIVLLPKQ